MKYHISETDIFKNWRTNLCDNQAKRRIQARIDRVKLGNFGDWKTERGEVRAMRIDYGPSYRLYYVIRNDKVVFLLCGGDKDTQDNDLDKAAELAKGI